jgi:hypothetical protein
MEAVFHVPDLFGNRMHFVSFRSALGKDRQSSMWGEAGDFLFHTHSPGIMLHRAACSSC